jgi:hypothetical protein
MLKTYKTQPYTMTVKIKTINVIFVLDLISIDGFLCCLISISCREQVQQY